jgi:hypothetical protein
MSFIDHKIIRFYNSITQLGTSTITISPSQLALKIKILFTYLEVLYTKSTIHDSKIETSR